MEFAAKIIAKAKSLLERKYGIHLKRDVRASIFASAGEDLDTDIRIDTIIFHAKEGLIHVNRQDICLIYTGRTLCRYKGWDEFLNIEEDEK